RRGGGGGGGGPGQAGGGARRVAPPPAGRLGAGPADRPGGSSASARGGRRRVDVAERGLERASEQAQTGLLGRASALGGVARLARRDGVEPRRRAEIGRASGRERDG